MGVKGFRNNNTVVTSTEKQKAQQTEINDAHKKLCSIAAKWLKKHSKNVIIPNCPTVVSEFYTSNVSGEIPDVLGWCYWTSVLIEVKISRQDFLADKNKPFRLEPEKGMGEFRYYCCPTGVISEEDLPENWGLLYYQDNKIHIVSIANRQSASLIDERTALLSIIRRKS
jgi:hypothetical protein